MRKTGIAILLVALLASTLTGLQFVSVAEANPYPSPGIDITLTEPRNVIYNDNTVEVVFTAKETHLRSALIFAYSLDGSERKPVLNMTTLSEETLPANPPAYFKTMKGAFALSDLSEGGHKLSIYGETRDASKTYMGFAAVDFFVDSTPVVSFLPVENTTFNSSSIQLDYTVNQPTAQVAYSLDGLENITLAENLTLTGLLDGVHNITLYATDDTGNTGASETFSFMVAVPEPSVNQSLQPFPYEFVVASVAFAVIVAAGLLLYFKKVKR